MDVAVEVKPTSSAAANPLSRDEKLLFVSAGLLILVGTWAALRAMGSGGEWRIVCGWPAMVLVGPAYLWARRAAPVGRVAVVVAAVVAVLSITVTAMVVGRRSPGAPGWLGLLASAVMLLVPGVYFARTMRRGVVRMSILAGLGLALVGAHAAMVVVGPVFRNAAATAPYLLAVGLFYAVLRRCEQEHYASPVQRKQRLSVTVITKNEADRVERCLRSVAAWADEIIVLDSGSDDATVEIARRYTDKVWVTDWPGYGPQKQRALEKATCEWVLSIDADEEATPELRHDIDLALGSAPSCVGYKLPWGVVVYGKLLDFGRSARAPLRLFRREGSRFTDAQVHETVVLPPGAVGRLHGRLLHYTQRDFGHALQKVATYGWLGARQRYAAGRRGAGLTGACLRSAWVFVQVYVIRLGVLDGRAGFLVAVLYAQVSFDKYAGLWALRREAG